VWVSEETGCCGTAEAQRRKEKESRRIYKLKKCMPKQSTRATSDSLRWLIYDASMTYTGEAKAANRQAKVS
jgi:hypothetical protein